MLFEQPAMTVNAIAEKLSVTYAGARKTIDKLVDIGILAEFPRAFPKTYMAPGIMEAARPAPLPEQTAAQPRLL